MVAGLEAAVEVDEERVPGRVDHLKDPLLAHKTAEKIHHSAIILRAAKSEFFLSSSVITSMAAVPLMTTWGWFQKEVNSP